MLGAALLLLGLGPGSADAAPPAHPTLTTAAPPTAPVGSPITDQATLSGGLAPTGAIAFSIFGPTDPTCSGSPFSLGSVAVNGNGTYTSPAITPTAVGLYHFQAKYSGDLNNAAPPPGFSACFALGEQVLVMPASPMLTTQASGTVPVGGTITDTATLTGAFSPSGTVTFHVYGAADQNCAAPPVFSSTVPVGAPTVSGAYTPTVAGVYTWTAVYEGDANNRSSAGMCSDPTETVRVGAAAPSNFTSIVQLGLPQAPSTQMATAVCDPQKMADALVKAIAAALTGTSGSAFQATCGGGVRIRLRAREIRPGSLGIPRHDGYTTIGDTVRMVPRSGQVSFSINSQGLALRHYAKSIGAGLLVFAIVRVTPNSKLGAANSIRVFTLH